MVTFAFLQQENKGYILQQNGGRLIIGVRNDDGGSAPGSKTKSIQKGVSAVNKQVLDRPTITATGTGKGSLLVTNLYNKTHSKIVFPLKIKMKSPLRMELLPNETISLIKIRPEINSEATIKLKVTKARAYCEMILENPLYKTLLNIKKEQKLTKLRILATILKEDLRKTPSINVDVNAPIHQRGDLMRITANMSEQSGKIYMRIIDDKGVIVQKSGLVKKNATGFQILTGTRDLKAGKYFIQVSNHDNFSPLGVAEFQVKGDSPILPFVPIIPFLLTPDSPTGKFTKFIFRTMQDSRVDAVCKKFENKKFKFGDKDAPIPPLHFNCRCWVEGIEEND